MKGIWVSGSERQRSAQSVSDDQRIAQEIAGIDQMTDPFVAAVRATRMPMIITNPRLPDNPVIFVNKAFCRLTGYVREEILGRNCRFLQGDETDPESVRAIHDAVADERPIEIEIRNHRKDGTAFWNRLLLAPVYDADQRLAYFFASQLDVTPERERLAGLEKDNAALIAELRGKLTNQEDRERELDFALKAGRFGTWSIDLRDLDFTCSSHCKTLFGVDQHRPFTYKDRVAAIHEDDRADAEAALQRSASKGVDYEIEYRIVRPDGQIRWLTSRGQPFFDADGRPLRLAGVSVDITEFKQAERRRLALAELSEKLRDLDDAAQISYAAAELIGHTLEVDRVGYGLVDRVAETITIERDWNAPGIRTIAGVLEFRSYGSYIDDLKRGETAIVEDARLDPRTVDTAPALEKISARAFINMPLTEQGGLVALLYLNHSTPRSWNDSDLDFVREVAERTRVATERRRAERELAELAASLEQQVADRTSELMAAEEALRQAQKMEAVGQLTGGLAHDFNNLLTGMMGNLELLQLRLARGRLEDSERFILAAQGAGRRAASLTQRLLAFSRRQTLDPKPTDVNRLISGMEELLRRTVGQNCEIEVVGAAGLWTANIDAGQLENALLNLCINARDAMPDGGRITIETANKWLDDRAARERDLPPGQYLSLCVSDTGTGMSAYTIEHAFEPFFTTKPIGEGTGLGLSMIYGFARQSNGQVRIYSEVGSGTTICIYLPRHLGEAAEIDEETSSMPIARSGGETILVVDDEATIRHLLDEVLEEAGYAVIGAHDGATGLKILQSDRRVDLLITDVGLPGGINGRQVADAARLLHPDLKILFITGYAENAAVGNGHLEPGMQLLTKPFTMDALAAKVTDMMKSG